MRRTKHSVRLCRIGAILEVWERPVTAVPIRVVEVVRTVRPAFLRAMFVPWRVYFRPERQEVVCDLIRRITDGALLP